MNTVTPYQRIIVCPTWACNCQCWYCYQQKNATSMTVHHVSAVEQFIARNIVDCYHWLWLEFFGGEPLLCLETIQKIAYSARKNCFDHHIRFIGGITTNGVLLNTQSLQQLEYVGINHFQITLDGIPHFHNKQRKLTSDSGTWEQIWNGLREIQASPLERKVVLRIHYRLSHLQQAIDLIEQYINPTFSTDRRFTVYFHEINISETSNIQRCSAKIKDQEKEAALSLLKASLAHEEMAMPLRMERFKCYASDPYSIIILPDGGIAKCSVTFERIGKLNDDGSLNIHEKILSGACGQ